MVTPLMCLMRCNNEKKAKSGMSFQALAANDGESIGIAEVLALACRGSDAVRGLPYTAGRGLDSPPAELPTQKEEALRLPPFALGLFFCLSFRRRLRRRPIAFPWRGRWTPASHASRRTDEVGDRPLLRWNGSAACRDATSSAPCGGTFPSRGKAIASTGHGLPLKGKVARRAG